jgi:hypothetical protein
VQMHSISFSHSCARAVSSMFVQFQAAVLFTSKLQRPS